MGFLISIPVLIVITILQTTVVSRMTLLNGQADLMLIILTAWALQRQVETSWQWSVLGGLFIDYFSGLPFGIYTVSYLAINGLALVLRGRIWRFSYVMHLLLALVGTLMIHVFSVIIIVLQGTPLELSTILQQVTLPSLLLNLLLTFPIFLLVKDAAEQFYPEEIEI